MTQGNIVEPNLVAFQATLGQTKVLFRLLRVQGPNHSLIPSALYFKICRIQPYSNLHTINPTVIYKGISFRAFAMYDRCCKMDVYLECRRGSSLILRNFDWKVPSESISSHIKERCMPE